MPLDPHTLTVWHWLIVLGILAAVLLWRGPFR
jgi:hypothetical protein